MATNTPQLRFPEFKDKWEERKLGEVATFSKGKGISKADITENGTIECIRYGELYTEYGEIINEVKSKTNIDKKDLVLSEYNDVIIPASGETQLDIATASCVLKAGVALGGDLNIIKSINNGVFLSFYLNSKKKFEIASLAQGISVVHLYASQLSLLTISFPTLPEQTKIANFLTAVDEKIQALRKKKELTQQYKKGIMQRIFSQELRFTDENGNPFPDWEEKKLGEVVQSIVDNRGKTPPIEATGIPLLEVNSLGRKEVNYSSVSKFVNEDVYKNWFRNYLKRGDILFSTVGRTASCSYFDGKITSVIAQNIIGLRFNIENSLFVFYLLTFPSNLNIIRSIEMGAVQPSIKVPQLKQLYFYFPSLPEQTKIANFLSAIDERIALIDTQLQQAEAWKKGLLQQMFC